MKKKNPTFERTYKMLVTDRKLRTKVFKMPSHFGILSKKRAKVIAKKVYEKGLKDESKET